MIQLFQNVLNGKAIFSAWLVSTAQSPDFTSVVALSGLLTAFLLLAKELLITSHKYIPGYRKEPKLLLADRQQRMSTLYKRIHNITEDNPAFPGIKPSAFRQYNNSDNLYNQAIKLIRGGMDEQDIVENCHISMGEAQLLTAMYGV